MITMTNNLTVLFFSLQFQISFQIVSKKSYRPCFHFFLWSSKSFQIPSQCMLKGHCFHFFLCSSQYFKYRQHACFRDIVFEIMSAVPNRSVRIYSLEALFLKCSLQFQIVSNTVRMHALESLPLVAIHHALLIWLFGNCVLL